MNIEDLKASIENYLTTEFEKSLFAAALRNLEDEQNPLRFNNFAYSTRELSRHILHRLAPDSDVLRCPWYKNETQKNGGISRKQRAYYAVQGGLSDNYVKTDLKINVDDIHKNLIESISELSKFTHIEEKVFALPPLKVEEYVNKTLNSLLDFLNLISTCRTTILQKIDDVIDDAVINEAIDSTIQELDELASHYYIESLETEEIRVESIDSMYINILVAGTVHSEMQWGSDMDVRNGDGVEFTTSFPYSVNVTAEISNPNCVEVKENTFKVDNSSWYENSLF